MPPDVSAFHDYALAVSHLSGVFYSNARRDAWEFSVSKNRVTRWIKWLEDAGWMERLDPRPRKTLNRATGRMQRFAQRNPYDWRDEADTVANGPKVVKEVAGRLEAVLSLLEKLERTRQGKTGLWQVDRSGPAQPRAGSPTQQVTE